MIVKAENHLRCSPMNNLQNCKLITDKTFAMP